MVTTSSNVAVIIPRRGINDEHKGKKHALHRLISASTADYVWLMDDDVIPAPALGVVPPIMDTTDLLILPIRMQSQGNSWLERLQKAEYAAIWQLTISSAQRGRAVMCSSANMLVSREKWLQAYEDIHPELASGDDVFLLESFKRRGWRVGVLDSDDYTASIEAQTSWHRFFRQRMRWAGKAPHYSDRDIIRCGAIVLMANILQLLCPLVILIKFPLEYRLIKKRDASVSLSTAFVLELLYPIYMLISLIGGLFRRHQW